MKTKQVLGIIIIIIGISFLLGEILNINAFGIVFDWWPILVVFYGIAQINKGKNLTSPIMIIIVGLFLLLNTLDIFTGNIVRNVIALLLILAGIQLFSGSNKFKFQSGSGKNDLNINSIFSGNHYIEESNNYKYGSVLALFGGVEIDFRNAGIQEEAFLDITCAFGGVEMQVPEDWEIRVQGTPIFGGFENKTHQKSNDDIIRPVLNINYTVIFGGVSMKN